MSQWEMVKLGDLFELSSGKFLPVKSRIGDKYPVYGGNGVTGYHNEFFIQEKTLCIGRVGEYCGCVHNVPAFSWITDNALYITKFKKETDLEYLCYILNNLNLNSYANKSGQPSLSQSNIKKIIIPLPPIEIQQKIAKTLDTAADLLKLRKQQLAEMDQLIQSVFYEMFGDPIAKENGWSETCLNNVCKKITDGTHQSPHFKNEGIPFLFVSNIINGKIIYDTQKFIDIDEYNILIKRTPIEIGDILYTIVGSYGNLAVVRSLRKFCFQRHIAYLKPDLEKINSDYVAVAMMMPNFRIQLEKRVRGIAQKTLNLSV